MRFAIIQLRAERNDNAVHTVFGEHRLLSGFGNIRRVQPIHRKRAFRHNFGKVPKDDSVIADLEIVPALLSQPGHDKSRLLIELKYFREFIAGWLVSAGRLYGGMIK